MNKTSLVLEALVTVRPVLAWKRAFKKPPAVPSATLRPVIELSPGYHSFTGRDQISAFADAFFDRRKADGETLRAEIDQHNAQLADTQPAKAPSAPVFGSEGPPAAYLDLGGRWSPF